MPSAPDDGVLGALDGALDVVLGAAGDAVDPAVGPRGAARGDEGDEQQGRHGPEGWSAACGAARRRTSIVHAGPLRPRAWQARRRYAGLAAPPSIVFSSGIAGRQPSGAGPSMRPPERLPSAHDVEAQALVQGQRPGRVRRRPRPATPRSCHARGAPRTRPRTAPWRRPGRARPPHRHVVEPAPRDAERRVLLGEDRSSAPSPTTSSPSQATHHSEVSVSGPWNRATKSRLLQLPVAPVVAERLVVGVPDRPVRSSGHRPELDAGGEGCSGRAPVRYRRISNPNRIGT